MRRAASPRWLATAFALLPLLQSLPALAGSALSAWRLSSEGGLELRTTPQTLPQAFFEAAEPGQGPRIWIDLPGTPQRSRVLPGFGSLRQVRIGNPGNGSTRVVLEFAPGIRLDPDQLRLVGTAPDRWKMLLPGLPPSSLPSLAEGDWEAVGWRPAIGLGPDRPPVSAAGLPVVAQGRFKVVIDPGHGGPDPGAVGIGGLRETDVVLDVALQVAELLQARGVQVLLTRTAEVDVDLPPRVALANSSGADLFVSIHANALSMARPDVNGIESFYFEGARSRSLAAALQQQLLAVSAGSPDRGVRQARFFVIRRTVMPASLVEMGFVTGLLDAPRLASAEHRRRLSLAIATGILSYLGGTVP